MDYDNQLVLTGQYSETGAYLTKNVKDSYRAGVEFVADVQPFKWLQWHGNLTLSKNKILHYSDWVDDWYADWNDAQVIENEGQVEVNYGNTDISFSPNITAGSVFSLLIKQLSVDFQTVYVGKQYLDNTQNEAASLNNYCVNNLLFTYSFFNQQTSVKRQKTAIVKDARLKLQINNIFNKTKYATNGGAYGYFEGADANGKFLPENQKYTPWFYAQAGINFHIGVAIDF
jgi:iron complex outermembrane receptor protein